MNPFWKNTLIIAVLSILLSAGLAAAVLFYTPLHDYFYEQKPELIPEDKQEVLMLREQISELEESAYANELYIKNIKAILSGQAPFPEIDSADGTITTSVDLKSIDLNPGKEDLELRREVEQEELVNLEGKEDETELKNLLFTPLKGYMTAGYDPKEGHLAVDIAAQQGEAIKSVGAGTVIFSNWTPETGYVIIIQHYDGMISVYKHALTVYKTQGNVVKKGEVIAAVGNTGELTTGPHLHFELWIDGRAADPTQYIVF